MFIKKLIGVIAIMSLSFNLSACLGFLDSKNSRLYNSEGERAEERLADIITALEANDGESIKKMFSQKALEEAEDIDDGIAFIMDFYKGKMVSHGDRAGETIGSRLYSKEKSKQNIVLQSRQIKKSICSFSLTN